MGYAISATLSSDGMAEALPFQSSPGKDLISGSLAPPGSTTHREITLVMFRVAGLSGLISEWSVRLEEGA